MLELGYSVTQSLRIYYEKGVSNLKQRLSKTYPRCVDWSCPIIPRILGFLFERIIGITTVECRMWMCRRINVISLRLESWFFFLCLFVVFFAQNAKIWAFETGYKQNFSKIKKLITFGPKSLNLDVWAQNFSKQTSDLKLAPSK